MSYIAPNKINFRGRKSSRPPHGRKIWGQWSCIFKFFYVTQLLYKRMFYNFRASAINIYVYTYIHIFIYIYNSEPLRFLGHISNFLQRLLFVGNISTRREFVEFRWDTRNTQTLPYWEYMGWKGRERQCGNGPHPSVLMDINNLEIRSLFTKLSLAIALVVWIGESGSKSKEKRVRRRECKGYTLQSFSLLSRSSSSSLLQKCFLWGGGSVCVPPLDYNLLG